MPCLLKERTSTSPGIITFTHNEALRGVADSPRVKAFLTESARDAQWLFGVHVQGHLNMSEWPLEPWQSFFMWPDTDAAFLSNVPTSQLLGVNCINFMPDIPPKPPALERNVDILVISRASTIKRINETLLILRGLMDAVPDFRATVIVPDMRQFELGDVCYELQGIDRRLYELPRRLFSSTELKRLSFIASSQQSFGWFPLSDGVLIDMLHRSKFVLLTSHREGTPRVLAEALLADVPCIVSDQLECGILDILDTRNSLKIGDEIAIAVQQIKDGLQRYHEFSIDGQTVRDAFSANLHTPRLRSALSERIVALGKPVEGRWFLDDLHLRLAGHGRKYSFQFMKQEQVFFNWLARNAPLDGGRADANFDPYDEDYAIGTDEFNDGPLSATLPPAVSLKNPLLKMISRLTAR
jgi:glycosyltransferase involved in cell wall biosynthesis